MVFNTRSLLVLLCIIEVIIVMGNFLYAENGLPAISKLQGENNILKKEIQDLKKEIILMEEQFVQWNKYPFHKEKIAREELHMIRDNELVYFNI